MDYRSWNVFELTYAAICDKLIQEAKVNHRNGIRRQLSEV